MIGLTVKTRRLRPGHYYSEYLGFGRENSLFKDQRYGDIPVRVMRVLMLSVGTLGLTAVIGLAATGVI